LVESLEEKVRELQEVEQLKEKMVRKITEIKKDDVLNEPVTFELIVRDAILKCIENTRTELPFSLTPKDLKELLPISDTKVYTLLERGEIPARKIGGKWAIPRDQFLAWFHGSHIKSEEREHRKMLRAKAARRASGN